MPEAESILNVRAGFIQLLAEFLQTARMSEDQIGGILHRKASGVTSAGNERTALVDQDAQAGRLGGYFNWWVEK